MTGPHILRSVLARPLLRACVLSSILWTVSTASLAGQGADWQRISQGDSVRLRLSGRMTVEASFDSWARDAMLVNVQGTERPWPVRLENMVRMDAYVARTPRESFRHGAVIGAAAGLFVGAGLGFVLHQTGVITSPDDPPSQIMTNVLRWSGLGAVAGGVTGGFYAGSHPGSGWIRIAIPGS